MDDIVTKSVQAPWRYHDVGMSMAWCLGHRNANVAII